MSDLTNRLRGRYPVVFDEFDKEFSDFVAPISIEAADEIDKVNAELVWYKNRVKELEGQANNLQAKIDSLMLEYCPDEITPEQIKTWESHQKVSEISEISEDRFLSYNGYWIVEGYVSGKFRVKRNKLDDFALHHGSFDTQEHAKKWINLKQKIK
jgi:hypothetical protein